MSKRITIAEVAREAEVSLSTISRVLNKRPDVAPETRQRVQGVIDRLGFHPSAIARSLDKQETNTFCLATLHFEQRGLFADPFFAGVIAGIVDTLTPLDKLLLVYPVLDTDESTAAFRSFLQSGRVDGLILHNAFTDDPNLSIIADSRVPCLALHYPEPFAPYSITLGTDDVSGINQLVDYLVAKGYRRIGHLYGDLRHHSAQQRLRLFREALQRRGLPVCEEWIQGGEFYERGGALGMQRILEAGERPSAVIAATDLMAIGALEVILAAGLCVPQDIAITGYDDIPSARFLTPALTTVHFAFGEMGSTAAQCLLTLIEKGQAAATHPPIPVKLIVRRSA